MRCLSALGIHRVEARSKECLGQAWTKSVHIPRAGGGTAVPGGGGEWWCAGAGTCQLMLAHTRFPTPSSVMPS